MAFTALTTAQIQVAEPVTQNLFQKTKDNFDDHETRIGDLEAEASANIPLVFYVAGEGRVRDALSEMRIPFNITVTNVILRVWQAGSSGTLDIDVQADTGSGFATILSSNITLAFGAGDRATASAAGLVTTDIDAGDDLRLDVDSKQTGASGFSVEIFYTVRS